MALKLLSRELRFIPDGPVGRLLFSIESNAKVATWKRVVGAGLSLVGRVMRFFGREVRIAGGGQLMFHENRARILRDPVRLLGERQPVSQDLDYGDITRLEFVAPDTVILGYGVVAPGLHQQAAIALPPVEAHDQFDALVGFLEDRDETHLFSVLDGEQLHYSRKWTLGERFPGGEMIQSLEFKLVQLHPAPCWQMRADTGEEFLADSSHGLVLVSREHPRAAIMQMFSSQVVDGTGFTLSRVQRVGRRTRVDVSDVEYLGLDPSGAAWLSDERIGFVPPEPMFQPQPEVLGAVFGRMTSVQQELGPPVSRMAEFDRPLPRSWALMFGLLSLLPAPSGASSASV